MLSFSQRKGLKPVSEIIQTDSMNDELRNTLWNTLDYLLWSKKNFINDGYGGRGEILRFSKFIWRNYFKKPVDTIPIRGTEVLRFIRNYFFECKWYEVYDFLEAVAEYRKLTREPFYDELNGTLERELSAYRFVNEQLTDITNEQEVEMLQEALQDQSFKGTSSHIQRALELYSDRKNPDYRNSIKESISAVESIAKIVADNPKATLGDALKAIEKKGQLHKALKEGFEKLYAYTSDAQGIRHAMLEEDNLTADDARYFLLSCTSFVNYLKSKI